MPKTPGEAIDFHAVALQLERLGLDAACVHTGGGIYCVLVDLGQYNEIYFGTAGETWVGIMMEYDSPNDMTVWTDAPSDCPNSLQVARSLFVALSDFLVGTNQTPTGDR